MKLRVPFITLAFSAVTLLAGVGNAFAAVLVSQLPNGDATISQEFPDAPAFSTYAFDDFTLTQLQALTTLQVFGVELGDASANIAVSATIRTALPGSGADIATVTGTEDVFGILNFDFSGLQLGAGTYWLTAFVTRNAADGQYFVGLSTPVNGSEAYLYNPGGALLGTSSPIPVSQAQDSPPSDLAFILSGEPVQTGGVPEPESLLLFAAAAAAMALARRRRAA